MQDHARSASASQPVQHKREQAGLQVHVAGAVATLTLARPASRNALSLSLLDALLGAVADIDQDDSIRAVIIAAEGPVFCAGHDLQELTAARANEDRGAAFYRQTMETCSQFMQAIVRSPKPFIAAVEGTATAAGCQLVATCDLAVAGDTARFCTPGVHIGLFCSTPMVALSRNLSRKHAMEMLLFGEMVPADRACEMGLINRVTGAGEALAHARVLAETIAAKSGQTVRIGKQAFYSQLEMGLSDAYAHAADVMTRNMLERDADEGISAFLEKRPPKWDQS